MRAWLAGLPAGAGLCTGPGAAPARRFGELNPHKDFFDNLRAPPGGLRPLACLWHGGRGFPVAGTTIVPPRPVPGSGGKPDSGG
ncbi:exported hypothetical protein [Cupriavidus phytorum]|uniref:Uncharacterized protein n=1 Tax=Cupriavidus taiwanensis TaxID=164546 RepID=A0A975X640_9BURK|nr:exported hypothetical protein [Cupriavidus taiwanensis]